MQRHLQRHDKINFLNRVAAGREPAGPPRERLQIIVTLEDGEARFLNDTPVPLADGETLEQYFAKRHPDKDVELHAVELKR